MRMQCKERLGQYVEHPTSTERLRLRREVLLRGRWCGVAVAAARRRLVVAAHGRRTDGAAGDAGADCMRGVRADRAQAAWVARGWRAAQRLRLGGVQAGNMEWQWRLRGRAAAARVGRNRVKQRRKRKRRRA